MKKTLQILFIFWLVLVQGAMVRAQNPDIKRTMHWYFGDHAGIDFSSGTAVADTNGQLNLGSSLGSSVISDTSGNLLFYTDGKTVYSKNHQIMLNGDSLYSFGSSHQSSIIIPKPLAKDIFYIFTTDGFEHGGINGLRYTTVDMTLNGGLGEVIEKNILLFNPNSEILAAVKHNNCKDIWVVAHERFNNCFRAYLVNENGVDTVPVITCIGNAGQYSPYGYILKFSPDGSKAVSSAPAPYDSITYELTGKSSIDFLKFNNTNGLFTDLISLQTDTLIVGFSFSPNSEKFYVNTENIFIEKNMQMYQFDISVWDSSLISSSRIYILPPTNADSIEFGDILLGADYKIYVAKTIDSFYLSIIHNPNVSGIASNFENNGIYLNGKISTYSLPNFIESYFNTVNCYTGIEDNTENNYMISVYPNPFNEWTTVSIAPEIQFKQTEISVFNITGKEVQKKIIYENSFQINRQDLQDGIYMLKMQINEQIYKVKILITN